MTSDLYEYYEEIKEKEKRKVEILSDILYSYERMLLTKEECDILSKEILDKMKENGLLGYNPPVAY